MPIWWASMPPIATHAARRAQSRSHSRRLRCRRVVDEPLRARRRSAATSRIARIRSARVGHEAPQLDARRARARRGRVHGMPRRPRLKRSEPARERVRREAEAARRAHRGDDLRRRRAARGRSPRRRRRPGSGCGRSGDTSSPTSTQHVAVPALLAAARAASVSWSVSSTTSSPLRARRRGDLGHRARCRPSRSSGGGRRSAGRCR